MTNKLSDLKEIIIEEDVKPHLVFTNEDREKVLKSVRTTISKRNHSKQRFNVQFVIAISLTAALLFLLVMSSPRNTDLTPTTKGNIEDLNKMDQSSLFTNLDQSVEQNGIKVTLDKVMYDGSRILVEYTAKSTTTKLDSARGNYRVTINGKKAEGLNLGPLNGEKEGSAIVHIELYKPFPDQFDLGLQINKIDNHTGNWNFTIPINKVEGDLYRFQPGVAASKDHIKLLIKELIVSESATKLRFETEYTPTDNRNSPLFKYGVMYELVDPNGNEIIPLENDGLTLFAPSFEGKHSSTAWYYPLKKLPEYVTLKAYINTLTNKNVQIKKSLNEPLPIELKQDNKGKIIVSKIEKKKNEVWIHYKIEGNLKQKRNNIMLKYEKNNEEQYFQPNNYPNYKAGKENVVKFDVKYSDNLFIVTNKIELKEFESMNIKIPLTDPK